MRKLWYAVMVDREDDDWGTGSFDKNIAMTMMYEINQALASEGLPPKSYIAVIDGGYDEYGEATTDPICVDEIEDLHCAN